MTDKRHPIRTRFARDIVAEVMLPERHPSSGKRKRGEQGKVIILCPGAPGSNSKPAVLQFLSERGYAAIAIRYRGTWESGGVFLQHSPAKDIEDVVKDLVRNKKIFDLFQQAYTPLQVNKIFVIGSSFGGPAALSVSLLDRVDKVVLLSPVIDWRQEGENEPFDFWTRFISSAFGGAYRVRSVSDWKKLLKHDFYNPLSFEKKINGNKIFMIHCEDDKVVPIEPAKEFSRRVGAQYYWKRVGGHLGLNYLRHKFFWKKIEAFLK